MTTRRSNVTNFIFQIVDVAGESMTTRRSNFTNFIFQIVDVAGESMTTRRSNFTNFVFKICGCNWRVSDYSQVKLHKFYL